MKLIFVLLFLFTVTVSAERCNSAKSGNVYKAKMEIKGICKNYTLRLLEGRLDTSQVEKSWKDENTGKTYRDVFGVANPCSIPDSINEGDIFYFIIDTADTAGCIICEAYYPTPPKKIRLKVVKN